MGQNGQIGPLNASLTCTLEKPYQIIVKCLSKRNKLVSELIFDSIKDHNLGGRPLKLLKMVQIGQISPVDPPPLVAPSCDLWKFKKNSKV